MLKKLNYSDRKEKFGIIAKIRFDDGINKDGRRTEVFSRDVTPNKNDYRDLMRSGEWLNIHSTDSKSKKWEWGTPTDYLGKGVKLLLFDKIEEAITVIADINPSEAFSDDDNYYSVRNVMVGKPNVLDPPIPTELITECGLKDPMALRLIPFEEITKKQYEELMRKYDNWNTGAINTDTTGVMKPEWREGFK